MPPVPPGMRPSRLVIYYQTMHYPDKKPISLLKLLAPGICVTHVIVAAFHIHASDPEAIHLNDDLPSAPLYDNLWLEAGMLRDRGVKVMCMLGGAAEGCFSRETLDAPSGDVFRRYYDPLRELIRRYGFQGIDLDVEQDMSLPGAVRLIDALRRDFGPGFVITLAPVAAALVSLGNLSGFDYFDLEQARGEEIAFYNTQFYNNWGDVSMLSAIFMLGWKQEKIVVGQLTSPDNGNGFEDLAQLRLKLRALRMNGIEVSGVMGWEYFNSRPGGRVQPWLWAREVSEMLGLETPAAISHADAEAEGEEEEEEAAAPGEFAYDCDDTTG